MPALTEEKLRSLVGSPITWSEGGHGNICFIDGYGYRTDATGKTHCIGPMTEEQLKTAKIAKLPGSAETGQPERRRSHKGTRKTTTLRKKR